MPEEDRATAQATCIKIGKDRTRGSRDILADKQTDRQTDRQTDKHTHTAWSSQYFANAPACEVKTLLYCIVYCTILEIKRLIDWLIEWTYCCSVESIGLFPRLWNWLWTDSSNLYKSTTYIHYKTIVDIRLRPRYAIPPLPSRPIDRIACAQKFSEYYLHLPGIQWAATFPQNCPFPLGIGSPINT